MHIRFSSTGNVHAHTMIFLACQYRAKAGVTWRGVYTSVSQLDTVSCAMF